MNENMKRSSNRISPICLVLLVLVILGTSVGGVAAYLSFSGEVSNELPVAAHPVISVDTKNNTVTVTNPGYAVYLRAAVVVNWQNDTTKNILATVPLTSEYELEEGEHWVLHNGFYYYTEPVIVPSDKTSVTTSSVVTLTQNSTKDGYSLVANVAVQAIQAVGETDEPNAVDAVRNAWGISAAEIEALGNQTP